METGERLKRNEPGINTFLFLGESMARQSVFGFICPLEADLVYQNVNELEFELSKM